jgi:23S rRNA pseudouridine1911/1915/1917 synthase
MHQIRVHLATSGWPIVGDATYGEARWANVGDLALAGILRDFPRQALHAWRVKLTHPVTGKRLLVDAPLPPDMKQLLAVCNMLKACSIGLPSESTSSLRSPS